MNGVHDMGGMHGMGAAEPEPNEPTFHHEWERRLFALTLAAAYPGQWNIDMSRYARELMPPAAYLASTYYEHWLFGLEKLLEERNLVGADEIAARIEGRATSVTMPRAPGRVLRAADVEKVIRKGGSARVNEDVAPRFKPGDHVLTRTLNPAGHTRTPRYARGRRGIIDRDHGVFIFPDTHAMTGDRKPQHVYSVRFAAQELWGPEASRRDAIYVDCWDEYLDLA